MGIGQQIISMYYDLFSKIDKTKIKNVCELGRQNLTINQNIDNTFFKLYKIFDKMPPKEVLGIAPANNWGIRSKIFYENLGINYFSIDVDNEEKNEKNESNLSIDLNFSTIDKNMHNKYDLVTNFGTSEHIFNQSN